MTLRLKVGRKGYIILPKAIREAVGIDEGDEVIVEIRNGIVLKPARRKVDVEKLKRSLRKQVEILKEIPGRKEPRPGELAQVYLEEEFGK
ncbi:AbrB/MazE/SpoVT family DNA-binding domain-containing protein [Candidatus Bathyarchaeota archaeon]|nr:MAG: AbrB/MazE/SpoVT family DNA-binding domain-containing protein [Candidatus Bathyarchaeota archaeon]